MEDLDELLASLYVEDDDEVEVLVYPMSRPWIPLNCCTYSYAAYNA